MILKTLHVVLEPTDLQVLISRIADKVDKLKDLSVHFEDDVVALRGKITLGLTIPFTTKWRARLLERDLCLTLFSVKVGMVGLGEDMISDQILSLLKSKLEDYDAARVEGRNVLVDFEQILAPRGVKLSSKARSVTITPSGIELVVD